MKTKCRFLGATHTPVEVNGSTEGTDGKVQVFQEGTR